MSVLANTITSTVQTTFSSIPNGVTPDTDNNTTQLATTAYVVANKNILNPALYLDRVSAQTMTGTALSFTAAQTATNIDSISVAGTLQVGETADGNLSIGQLTPFASLSIKTYLQPITNLWKFWMNGSVNTTVASGVAVECKRVLTGSHVQTTNSTPVVFTPPFTSKPVVIVSLRSTGSTVGLTQNKWAEGVGINGFTARTTGGSNQIVYNWFAIGT